MTTQSKSKTKIVETYTYTGFGFPVVLKNVTMYKIAGNWTPKIDVIKLSKKIVKTLKKNTDYNGYEFVFIRNYLRLSSLDLSKKMKVTKKQIETWESRKGKIVPFSEKQIIIIHQLL